MNIESLSGIVKHLDSMVRRASDEMEHYGNRSLAARLRTAWVRLRAVIMKEWQMSKQAKNDYEQYILFWESHLEEYSESTDDGIITHDGDTEQVWTEVVLV